MRTRGSPKELEKRRFKAIELLGQGYAPVEIAKILDVDRRSVRAWNKIYREKGAEGLKAKPAPGAPTKLTDEQIFDVQMALLAGAQSHGYTTNLWTIPRVTELIETLHGVAYSEGHVWKLMMSWGWTAQKPERRAIERDEEAILRWVNSDWERIKKTLGVEKKPLFS